MSNSSPGFATFPTVNGDTPFLRQLAPADAEQLMQSLRRRRVAKSQAILRAGSAGDEVALVIEGRVKLTAYGADKREVVIGLRGAGELIGEMAALVGQRRTATATAVDEAEVGFMSAANFRAFLHEHPDASLVVIRMLVRRLFDATRDVIDLATQDSVGMVAKRLIELSPGQGAPNTAGTKIELSLTQDELARWTGATRETVSRAIRMMRSVGWITTGNRTITVLDPAALRARCGMS